MFVPKKRTKSVQTDEVSEKVFRQNEWQSTGTLCSVFQGKYM